MVSFDSWTQRTQRPPRRILYSDHADHAVHAKLIPLVLPNTGETAELVRSSVLPKPFAFLPRDLYKINCHCTCTQTYLALDHVDRPCGRLHGQAARAHHRELVGCVVSQPRSHTQQHAAKEDTKVTGEKKDRAKEKTTTATKLHVQHISNTPPSLLRHCQSGAKLLLKHAATPVAENQTHWCYHSTACAVSPRLLEQCCMYMNVRKTWNIP